MSDITSTVVEGTKWLLENELITSPYIANILIKNIQDTSLAIKDIRILSDSYNKKMLIYLKLNLWGRLFLQKKIQNNVQLKLKQGLPSFNFRVIYDNSIYEKALKISQKLLEQRNLVTRS